eukprot:SAG31_NODE_2363_length_5862_cov_2.146452_2_plen_241_part_00
MSLPLHETSLLLVIEELIRVDSARGPNEKLCFIFNFHHGLCRLLALAGRTSADDYVPLLAYCILKADPRRLLSNIQYVSTFASTGRRILSYEKALLDFSTAVKCLLQLRPTRLAAAAVETSPAAAPTEHSDGVVGMPFDRSQPLVEDELSASQLRLLSMAQNMGFARDDVLLALAQVQYSAVQLHNDGDTTTLNFAAAKLQMLEWLLAVGELRELHSDRNIMAAMIKSVTAAEMVASVEN